MAVCFYASSHNWRYLRPGCTATVCHDMSLGLQLARAAAMHLTMQRKAAAPNPEVRRGRFAGGRQSMCPRTVKVRNAPRSSSSGSKR